MNFRSGSVADDICLTMVTIAKHIHNIKNMSLGNITITVTIVIKVMNFFRFMKCTYT
jgi:hypothetical protein